MRSMIYSLLFLYSMFAYAKVESFLNFKAMTNNLTQIDRIVKEAENLSCSDPISAYINLDNRLKFPILYEETGSLRQRELIAVRKYLEYKYYDIFACGRGRTHQFGISRE